MKKILNISFVFCLLGAVSSLFFSINQGNSDPYSDVYATYGDSLHDKHDVPTFSRSTLFLLFAEAKQDITSELDPQKYLSVNWSTKQNTNSPQLQYIVHAQRFLLSQSVRNLIYPFHTFT